CFNTILVCNKTGKLSDKNRPTLQGDIDSEIFKIKKIYPDANLRLPGKKIFGNLDPEFIKQRREGLDDFIQKLASHPKISQNPEVRSFLSLDSPKHAEESVDADTFDDPDTMSGRDANPVNLGPSEKKSVKPSDFEFLKVIGKGSFGKVLLARHKHEERIYAIKVLQKQAIMKRNEVKHIMSERSVLLKNVKHPFLVGLHYSFQTPDKLYFVLDYVNGGELFFHLQRERYFPEPRARFYAAEMASALGYLHSLNIIYRDLKPENILLDSKPPFYSRDTAEMYDNILYKPLRLRTNVSPVARSVLEGLLQKDKEQRLGARKDFMDIKIHPFFADINWNDLDNKKIPPPYNPNVSGQLDLKHFDPEFVREPVPASVGKSAGCYKTVSASVMEADGMFQGFSYVPPSEDAFS
ncbi:hypothetical protein KUTeg_016679, partial [Tegillarca granosa]